MAVATSSKVKHAATKGASIFKLSTVMRRDRHTHTAWEGECQT